MTVAIAGGGFWTDGEKWSTTPSHEQKAEQNLNTEDSSILSKRVEDRKFFRRQQQIQFPVQENKERISFENPFSQIDKEYFVFLLIYVVDVWEIQFYYSCVSTSLYSTFMLHKQRGCLNSRSFYVLFCVAVCRDITYLEMCTSLGFTRI